jgi:pilus assembly protein Flp/PilA
MTIRTVGALMFDESGQGLVEYALVIALVAIVAIASLRVLGLKASNTLNNAAERLS